MSASQVRNDLYQLLKDAMPSGVYVYRTPPDQMQAPGLAIETMEWAMDRMNRLDSLEWDIGVKIVVSRNMPDYSINTIESLSLDAAGAVIGKGFRVVGFTDMTKSGIGGTEYLTGTLSIIYKQRGDS